MRRLILALSALWVPAALAPAQIGIQGTPVPDFGEHAERERGFDLQHLAIEARIDIQAERITGSVTHSLVALRPGLVEVELDCEGLTVHQAEVRGRPADFRSENTRVVVVLDPPAKDGEKIEVRVGYEGISPARGLYFIHAGADDPEATDQAWTQGQEEDTHFWVPLYDRPNDRATWETRLVVQDGLTAVSNGTLLSVTDAEPGWRLFHHRLDQPNSTYLIAFAVGPWERYADQWRGIPVEYYVNRGVGEATARRSFGETPDMMEFFSNLLDEPYPWPKYAQVAVSQFVAGGMENVSCTLQSDRTLHDEAAHLERTSRGLVAHELAHQWFGDLVTCRTWADLWLNEGFATYYDALYTEHVEGADAFRLEMWDNQHSFMRADPADAPRPMVADFYSRVDGRVNAHVYSKGASVLHMLRFNLGDAAYHKAIAHYLDRHRLGLVEARDLQIAVADATGRNLEWFFEQWVHLAGYPKFQVAFDWDAGHGQGTLSVKQTQATGGLVPVFRTPVDVEIVAGGTARLHRIFVDRAEQTFTFPVSERPSRVRFDKGGWLVKTLDFPRPLEERIDTALHDDDVIGRLEAVLALGEDKGERATRALLEVMRRDPHKRIRAEAAEALQERDAGLVRSGLMAALDDPSPDVRRAAADTLGRLPGDPATHQRLIALVEADPAYGPRERALRALARLKAEGALAAAEKALATPSDRDRIAQAGLDALIELDRRRAVPHVLAWLDRGMAPERRAAALRAAGRVAADLVADERDRAVAAARAALTDGSSGTKRAALAALQDLAAHEALADIDALAADVGSRRLRDSAKRAADAIRGKERSRLDPTAELRREIEALKARIEQLEGAAATAASTASTGS